MRLSWKNVWQIIIFFMRKTIVNHSKLQRAPSSWTGKLSESRVFPQEIQGQEMRQWAFPDQININLTFGFEQGQFHFWIWVRFLFFIFLFVYSYLIYYIQTAVFFPSCLPRSCSPLPTSFIPPVSLQKRPGLPGITTLIKQRGPILLELEFYFGSYDQG